LARKTAAFKKVGFLRKAYLKYKNALCDRVLIINTLSRKSIIICHF